MYAHFTNCAARIRQAAIQGKIAEWWEQYAGAEEEGEAEEAAPPPKAEGKIS